MTLKEFKAWFEGFTESMDKAPTAKQWARIKERVGEIDGTPVTERVFIDRYWSYPHYPAYPYWTPYYSTSGGSIGVVSGTFTAYVGQNAVSDCYNALNQQGALGNYNSTQAMYLAGKADQSAMGNA